MESMIEDGEGPDEIAIATGFNKWGIQTAMKRRGLVTTRRSRIPPATDALIADWYLRRIPNREIMRHFHISEVTIYRALNRRGVSPNRCVGQEARLPRVSPWREQLQHGR